MYNIEKVKKRGYFIELHYIGVEGVDIAKERVLERDISGNWDNTTCLDIDPDTLYGLPYAKEAIA